MIKKKHRSFGNADLVQPTNHYLSRNEKVVPSSSMGKFLSNRMRDSIYYTRSSSPPEKHILYDSIEHEAEDFDEADYVATPEPPLNDNFNSYHRRPLFTPSSTSSNTDSYFTRASPDIKKFSRHVELSSGYNILKSNNQNKPLRLPAYLQGRAPLVQINTIRHQLPMPSLDDEEFQVDGLHRRRLSFNSQTNSLLNSTSLYSNKNKFHYNSDGSQRPFSSDSPVPPLTQFTRVFDNTISSAPPVHNRSILPSTHYHEGNSSTETNLQQQLSVTNHNLPFEPLKFSPPFAVNITDHNEENNSIAALNRELRAAAYPSNHRQSSSSPTRESITITTNISASPPTSRYSTRNQTKRSIPRSLPKLNDQNSRKVNHYSYTSFETNDEKNDDLLQSSSSAALLDQFFSLNVPPTQQERSQLLNITGSEQSESILNKTTPELSISAVDDLTTSTTTTRTFLSKYLLLAPITTTTSQQMNVTIDQNIYSNLKLDEVAENNIIDVKQDEHQQQQHVLNYTNEIDTNQTVDALNEDYRFDMNLSMTSMLNNDRSNHNDLTSIVDDNSDNVTNSNYDYVSLNQEQQHSIIDMPLLELDELETASDISESQLVPIVYAKDLANEIALLQQAHQANQQQKREQREARLLLHQQDEDDRMNDNNSVPPPANIELLNFDTLDDELLIKHECVNAIPIATTTLTTVPNVLYKNTIDDTISNYNENSSVNNTEMDISISSTPPLILTTTSNVNSSCLWYRLPTELWFKVLPYLNQNEFTNFSLACKRFYLLVQDQACQHRTILYRKSIIKQEWLHTIARRKPMALAFIECRQQNLEQEKDSTQTSLVNNNFDLSNHVGISEWNEFFETISSNLIDITITSCYYEPFTPNFLMPIVLDKCKNIKTLNLSWNNLIPITFDLLSHHQFSSLDLSGCQTLTDLILTQLFVQNNNSTILSTSLTILRLNACVNITWSSLTSISQHVKSLKHLNIRQCIGLKHQLNDDNLNCFQYWSNMEYLDLSQLLSLTDNDILKITTNCKDLKHLYLDGCINLTSQTLYTIGNNLYLTLESISLENCINIQHNDAYLFLIRQCSNLHFINLSLTCVNDSYIYSWTDQNENNLNKLEILLLNFTKCTMDGIKIILDSCKNLKQINLTGIINQLVQQNELKDKYENIKFIFQAPTH